MASNEDSNNPNPNPLIPPRPPQQPSGRPGGRGTLAEADDGSMIRLLPEWGEDMGGMEREHAAMINEAMYPMQAIRVRCEQAGYEVPAHAA